LFLKHNADYIATAIVQFNLKTRINEQRC